MNKTSVLEKAKELNILRRNCMETKEELKKAIKDTIKKYKEIMFGGDIPACLVCLDELRKQQVIDKKVYDQMLIDDTLRKLAWDELQMLAKQILRVNFIPFVDHKITCLKVEGPHFLSSTDTLDT